MRHGSILIMLHCEQNTEYAIAPLERVFESAARLAGYGEDHIHWSYSHVYQPGARVHTLKYRSPQDARYLEEIIKQYAIETILAFDMPYPTPVARAAHKAGVKRIVSYWGASMSSINTGPKLLLKRLGWYLAAKAAPTSFIFESKAMLQAATNGRGVPRSKAHLIPLGVDTNVYYPEEGSYYAHTEFGIPKERRIIFYSGHMEERKGVRVLINAMLALEEKGQLDPFHLLICGNRENEASPFLAMLEGHKAKQHVTFAGYRRDIPQLMRSSFLGAIASTGWDSFTMSSVEMMASGLPVIVSELQGLKDTIETDVCGRNIKPGDASSLARHLLDYLANPIDYQSHRAAARLRAELNFTLEHQVQSLTRLL